jgi:hypothetical protein
MGTRMIYFRELSEGTEETMNNLNQHVFFLSEFKTDYFTNMKQE